MAFGYISGCALSPPASLACLPACLQLLSLATVVSLVCLLLFVFMDGYWPNIQLCVCAYVCAWVGACRRLCWSGKALSWRASPDRRSDGRHDHDGPRNRMVRKTPLKAILRLKTDLFTKTGSGQT
jgi:hypothetical protein